MQERIVSWAMCPMLMKWCGCHNLMTTSKSNCWACNGQWKYNERHISVVHLHAISFVWHAACSLTPDLMSQIYESNYHTYIHTHTSPKHECYLSTKQTNEWMDKNKFPFGSFYLGRYQNTLDKLYHRFYVSISIHTHTHILHQHRNESVKMKLI